MEPNNSIFPKESKEVLTARFCMVVVYVLSQFCSFMKNQS